MSIEPRNEPLPAPPGRCRVRPPKCVAPPRTAAAATSADYHLTRRHRAPPGRGGAAHAGGGAWRSTGHRGDGSSGCGGGVAVASEGAGGAFNYLGGLAEGAAALATAGEVAGTLAARRSGNGRVGCQTCRRRCLRPGPRHGMGTRSSGPSRAARTRPCRTSGPPTT